MKLDRILNLVFGVVIIAMTILLFQSGCNNNKNNNTDEIKELNELISNKNEIIAQKDTEISSLRYITDSLKALNKKEIVRVEYEKERLLKQLKTAKSKKDTVTKDSLIYVEVEDDENKLQILQETTYFNDTTYKLISNIFHTGTIDRIDYLFETIKYPVNFIPPKRYITREVIVKEKSQARLPRLYGLIKINTKDYYIPNNFELGLTIQDNKHRQYSVSINPIETKQFSVQYQHPIFYLKR